MRTADLPSLVASGSIAPTDLYPWPERGRASNFARDSLRRRDRNGSTHSPTGRFHAKLQVLATDLATHYRTAILPTRARKPRDKAKVEVAVPYAEATLTQSLPDWIGAHVRALAFMGGVPAQRFAGC